MNRLCFLLAGWALSSSVSAQVVLQQPSVPVAGYSADLNAGAFIEPTPGSDAPQTWDFSDVMGSAVGLQEVLPASSSSLAPAFEGAEWVNANGDQLTFWRWDNGSMSILGNANATNFITIAFDDPLVQWTYPLSFGDLHEDTFSIEDTLFSVPYSLEGFAESEVDAHGSLLLPTGDAIPEVLRVRYEQVYTEAYDGDTAIWTLNQSIYHAPDSLLGVFFQEALTVTDAEGNLLVDASDVAWYDNTVVAVPEQDAAEWAPVFPNPVRSGEAAQWQLSPGQEWQAVDTEGRILDRGRAAADGRVQLSTAGWSGLVLLVPMRASGRAADGVQRLIVKGC